MVSREFTVVLIHNFERDRLLKIIPRIKEIELSGYTKSTKEYCKQDIKRYNFLKVFHSTFLFVVTSINWSSYLKKRRSIRKYYDLLCVFLPLTTPRRYSKYKQKVALTHEATLKHVKALMEFVVSSEDYILILESDAEIYDTRLLEKSLLEAIEYFAIYDYCYVLVGGGLQTSKLGIEALSNISADTITMYERAFTNTTVAYFLNRKTAELLLKEILSFPRNVPYFGADWVINYSLIRLHKSKINIKGLIFNEEIVGHGSVLGLAESWQSKFN